MNPYQDLPQRAFWKPAGADRDAMAIGELWAPKFPIERNTSVVTAGSCFAQHIGLALQASGYAWLDLEPCPLLPASEAKAYGYGLFSFRAGNIYTAALLKQWLRWAMGKESVPAELWTANGRWLDPFRPAIEPGGFASSEELLVLREQTLCAIRRAVQDADIWVFTLGLTEGWRHRQAGYWYPACPGTLGGTFDPALHEFHNASATEVAQDLREVVGLLREARPTAKLLLTVSPVPLTATASGQHVLVATEYSKAVLRAAAGEIAKTEACVDYFPSYEIITSHPFRGAFFDHNLRTVTRDGVEFVMRHFFAAAGEAQPRASVAGPDWVAEPECEEALLEAFAPR